MCNPLINKNSSTPSTPSTSFLYKSRKEIYIYICIAGGGKIYRGGYIAVVEVEEVEGIGGSLNPCGFRLPTSPSVSMEPSGSLFRTVHPWTNAPNLGAKKIARMTAIVCPSWTNASNLGTKKIARMTAIVCPSWTLKNP